MALGVGVKTCVRFCPTKSLKLRQKQKALCICFKYNIYNFINNSYNIYNY
nr:MAG TPA: Divergent 4Fe-4S mono-cluster [Bacteriophage sp.]